MNLISAGLTIGSALLQSQVLGSIFSSNQSTKSSGASSAGDLFSTLLSQQQSKHAAQPALAALLNPGQSSNGLSANGRNLSLFNPEAGYNLSTFINSRDVLYKAQYSGLSQIKAGVSQLQAAGESLGDINANTPAAGVEALLQNFVERYNHWRETYSADVADGGLLDKVQAAEISLYQFEQSIKNPFLGAKDDIRGLRELGISIDPNTQLAKLDTQQLAATLSAKPQAVVHTIQDFSAQFAKSAALLNSDNNFIPNQLNNLSRAIHYIADNQVALKLEFGTGDPAKPNARVAQALAAYNRQYA